MLGERTNDGLRVRKRDRANALTALQLERHHATPIATRRREIDRDEIARVCALARTVQPPIGPPLEERARKRELIALEREERTLDLVLR